MNRFFDDETGLLTFEWVMLFSILCIGIIAGITALRDSMSVELIDIANAANHADQTYSYPALKSQILYRSTGTVTEHTGLDANGVFNMDAPPTTGEVISTGWNMSGGVSHGLINNNSTQNDQFEIHPKTLGVH